VKPKPPHPNPLPKGEGGIFPLLGTGELVIVDRVALMAFPLQAPPPTTLGKSEEQLLSSLTSESRRREWLAGRAVAKELLRFRYGLDPAGTEVLPDAQEVPQVHSDASPPGLRLSISHSRFYAAAACAASPVGVDVCDLQDSSRLERVRARVFEGDEAERVGAFDSREHSAATWAIKEASLKATGGGVFAPGARSVRVLSLMPPRVATPDHHLRIYRLPQAMLAVARVDLDPAGGLST
jgi:phosphopantetheinyl transferase